jgi:hypothetical protein
VKRLGADVTTNSLSATVDAAVVVTCRMVFTSLPATAEVHTVNPDDVTDVCGGGTLTVEGGTGILTVELIDNSGATLTGISLATHVDVSGTVTDDVATVVSDVVVVSANESEGNRDVEAGSGSTDDCCVLVTDLLSAVCGPESAIICRTRSNSNCRSLLKSSAVNR